MSHNLWKVLFKMACILVGGGLVGTVLLTLVYCIPVDRMYANYQSVGLDSIQRREGWHKYLVDYDISTLDNNTEWLMLKAASTPLPETGENVLQKAMRCYTLNAEWNHGMTFQQYNWKGESLSCDSYERYWHGYLVILKPLLTVFTYTDLVYLNIACQALILFGIIYTLFDKQKQYLLVPFMFFWIMGMQLIIALSLDYSVCFYIYSAAILVLLHYPVVKEKYIYFFLIIGMLTGYMDLLTWPLVTLAIPLVIFVQTEEENRIIIKKLLAASFLWAVGYIGMWALKWIIASVLLRDNVIVDAVERFLMRSALASADAGEAQGISIFLVIRRNLEVFFHGSCAVVLAGIALWLLVDVIRHWSVIRWRETIPCLMIALFPFGWYLITRNHSYTHYWMTWRNLSICVFAICCGLRKAMTD